MYGPFSYTKALVNFVENTCGIYYLLGKDSYGQPGPVLYVGMAGPEELRSKLLEHLNSHEWHDVAYFQYRPCGSAIMALLLESLALVYFNPKYNYPKRMARALTI